MSTISNSGTSGGAVKGWETRKGGPTDFTAVAREVIAKGHEYNRNWQWGSPQFGGPFQVSTTGKRLGRLKLEGGMLKWKRKDWLGTLDDSKEVGVKFGGNRPIYK